MIRVAAIDCGTNSIRLLVADVADTTLTDVVRRMEIVRLGQGVDRTGRLAPEALDRTFAALREYAEVLDREGAERVRMVATSATRDAANRAEFVTGVRATLGVYPEVLSGAEEAELSFLGATRELRDRGTLRPPYLVVDIGGGSTEFIVGTEHAAAAVSVDVGCVRLTERHFATDPPTSDQVVAASRDVDEALESVAARVPVRDAKTLIGLAGTVTTVAGMARGLPAYDPDRIHHSVVARGDVARLAAALLAMSHDERAAVPVMHPGRVDVIAAGALVLDRVMQRFGFVELVASEHDILDGIAWSLA